MRIITWNVNGVRARERDVLELVSKHAPDVLCMQEIKSSPDQLPPGLGVLIGLPDYTSRCMAKAATRASASISGGRRSPT